MRLKFADLKRYLFLGALALTSTASSAKGPPPADFIVHDSKTNFGVLIEKAVTGLFEDKNADGIPDFLEIHLNPNAYNSIEEFKAIKDDMRSELIRNYADGQEAIAKDFLFLLKRTELPNDPKIAKRWGIPNTTSAELFKWFTPRVHVFTINKDTDKDEFWDERFKPDTNYPISESDFQLLPENDRGNNKVDKKDRSQTLFASNHGRSLINRSLKSGYALRYQNPNYPALVTGSRFGLVGLSPKIFNHKTFLVDDGKRINKLTLVARIFRIATYFHEARHSDGNSNFYGFSHTTCPGDTKGVDSPKCDRFQNGANAIERDILKLFLQSCDPKAKNPYKDYCTAKELSLIDGLIFDAQLDIISSKEHAVDGDGLKVIDLVNSRDETPASYRGYKQMDLKVKK